MKIEMITTACGPDLPALIAGQVYIVPDAFGKGYIKNGFAKAYEGKEEGQEVSFDKKKAEVVEAAPVAPAANPKE